MRYIERVVWKSADWYADGPDHEIDQRPGKPHGLVVDLGDGRMLMASAPHGGTSVTIGVTGGLRISIPADHAEDVAEAILYAHRCACSPEVPAGIIASSAMQSAQSSQARTS